MRAGAAGKKGLSKKDFLEAVKELLEKGRGKGRNILITGPANCGQTFILNPLTKIFKSFCNPTTGSFAWVGVEDKELIFLNDFRWEKSMIHWSDMLLLLEGQLVHLRVNWCTGSKNTLHKRHMLRKGHTDSLH